MVKMTEQKKTRSFGPEEFFVQLNFKSIYKFETIKEHFSLSNF